MTPRHALLPFALLLASSSALAARGFQARDLAKLDRYSSPTLSPERPKLVFAKRVVDYTANKSSTSLWIEDLSTPGAKARQLTPGGWNVNSPAFSPDGRQRVLPQRQVRQFAALRDAICRRGTPEQVTALPVDVDAFLLSPDGKRVAVAAGAFPECGADLACTRRDRRRRQRQGHRHSLRPPVHPPLGHLGRRPHQPPVRRAPSTASGGEVGDARRLPTSIADVPSQTVRRPRGCRLGAGRQVAGRQRAPVQRRRTAVDQLRPLPAQCRRQRHSRRTSPPPTRPGTPARCSRRTARRCTTSR